MKMTIQKLKILFTFSSILLLFGCGTANNATTSVNGTGGNATVTSIDLTWDPPTTYMNGSALTNLVGYKLYMGTTTGNLTLVSDVGNTTTYTVSNVAPGTTVYFAVTAYDSNGVESDMSNLVS